MSLFSTLALRFPSPVFSFPSTFPPSVRNLNSFLCVPPRFLLPTKHSSSPLLLIRNAPLLLFLCSFHYPPPCHLHRLAFVLVF
ncbi:hypothetical protein E2C01_035064 [Portunus trituberculatus]|uniref:Uncharacterized protein n=1 Tax=Portunus trituberculatus TaxID=210409 RepID=A0A5B7F266_PORTR|nr:hypothetical protein [Portunus trituberculatus]